MFLDEFLFTLVLGNGLSNTTMHGKKNGRVEIKAFLVASPESCSDTPRFCVTLSNEPGEKHEQNLHLQANRNPNPDTNAKPP